MIPPRVQIYLATKQRHGQSRENRTSEALIEAEMPIRTVTGK